MHRYIVVSLLIFLFQNSIALEELVLVTTNSHLPSPRELTAVSYTEGSDYIYIFGGSDPVSSLNEVLRYSISSDTIELLNHLPSRIYSGTTSTDADSNIYFHGGYYSDVIYKFNPTTNTIVNVSTLPLANYGSTIVKENSNSEKVYILSGASDRAGIVLFDMNTLMAERIGNLSIRYNLMEAVSDDNGSAYLFGMSLESNEDHFVAKLNLTSFGSTIYRVTLPSLYGETSVVWTGDNAYMMGGYNQEFGGIRGDSILKFDPETMSIEAIPIANFPVEEDWLFSGTSAVFVSSLNRIYVIGGFSRTTVGPDYHWFEEIWYIDLSPDATFEPTEATTTMNPEIFTCLGRPDGMYTHPADCAKFINCHSEEMAVFTCPEPLLFDPVGLTCTLPHLVDCEISCDGKPDGVYPHPHDCALFMGCVSEIVEIYRCPSPLLFDPVMKRCDLPELVTC